MSSKKNKRKTFGGRLADKLRELNIEPADANPPTSTGAPVHADTPPPEHCAEPVEAERPLTDAELFARAIEDKSPGDVYRGKYKGDGVQLPPASSGDAAEVADPRVENRSKGAEVTAPPDDAKAAREAQARRIIEEKRAFTSFERAVGPMDVRMDQDRYHRPAPPRSDAAPLAPVWRSEPPELMTPTLPKQGPGLNAVAPLDASQNAMLKRVRRYERRGRDVPELNVRGDSQDDALRQLELFVHKNWKDGSRFVRIIHGRGLGSEDGIPVLKPAVLRWLEGPGLRYILGYVPVLTSGRDYGSLIVELKRRDASEPG